MDTCQYMSLVATRLLTLTVWIDIILIPTIISIAQVAGFNPVALALPASFMICDTITLPPHSKVNLTYYSTGKFTVLEEMTYGVLTLLAKWGIMVAASFTWFKMIGIM